MVEEYDRVIIDALKAQVATMRAKDLVDNYQYKTEQAKIHASCEVDMFISQVVSKFEEEKPQ